MLSLEAQKKKFLSLKSKNSIKAGSTAYLISASWFNRWKKAVGIDSQTSKDEKKSTEKPKIPPINNKILLIDGQLKPTLTEKYDFIILSPPLWKLLYEWYPGEGPEIQVKIIDHPVEHIPVPIIHELTFSVYYSKSLNTNDIETKEKTDNPSSERETSNLNFVDIKVNKYQKILDIKEKVCDILGIDPDKAIIRDFWNYNSLPPLQDDAYIYNKHLVDTQELLLQIKDTKSPMAQRRNRLVSRTNSSMTMGNTPFLSFTPRTQGHVGLSNLGNTCFFNSAVQALSHTEMLAAFFMNANWRENINSTNRFSTNGIITNAYAQIVNDIWNKNFPFLSPKRLFDVVAKYAPRFGDHMQHDSQELMMFLLDGLHEDLNRANKNVYIEGVEGDSSSQQVAAEAAWKRHKLTNDSIIVDLFHGQLESQLECPNCHCKKIVFDPYLCVTLPMPTEKMCSVKYLYVPYDMKQVRQFVKIRVITSREEDDVRNDAIERFNILSNKTENETKTEDGDNSNSSTTEIDEHKDCLIIERDDLISNYGVKLPPSLNLRKIVYIVFEVPDNRKLYTLASVHAEVQKKANGVIADGPVLVEVPEEVLMDQEKIIQIINHPKSKKTKKNQKQKKSKKTQKKSKTIKSKKTQTKKKKEIEKKNGNESTIVTRSAMRTRSQTTTVTTRNRRSTRTKEETVHLYMRTRSHDKNKKPEKEEEQEEIDEYEEEENNEEENDNEEEEEGNDDNDDQILSIFKSISDNMQKASQERFNVYWEETSFPLIDSHRQMDLDVSTTISRKLKDSLEGLSDKRMFAEPVNVYNYYENEEIGKLINTLRLTNTNNFYFFEKSEDYSYISSNSMKISLNPLLSRTAKGFKWQALMPLCNAINKPEETVITLKKCLECFSYPDKLDKLNEWFCPTCRKLVRAIARLDIWSVPDNLILHLKRFVYKDGNYKKVFGKINFPEVIDMQPFVRGPQKNESLKYRVHAVINHIGTMNGGHYTTSAFSTSEDKWYTYNDEAVYQTSENITYSEMPYVLFYHRINDNEAV